MNPIGHILLRRARRLLAGPLLGSVLVAVVVATALPARAQTLATSSTGAAGTPAPAGETAYVYSSFRGKGDGLHLAVSLDGLRWHDLNRILLRPAVGEKLFRDPHLFRDDAGLFHLVWTSGWNDRGIGYATSRDLVAWSAQRFLPVSEKLEGVRNTWAPEIVPDPANKRYLITWTSEIPGWFTDGEPSETYNNRTYYVTTTDFVSFGDPALLIEPGFDHVDTSIVSWRGKYIALFRQGDIHKQRKYGAHHLAMADTAAGPYHQIPGNPVSGRAEGAAFFTLGDRCLLFVPVPGQNRVIAVGSSNLIRWEDLGAETVFVPGQTQGNVVPVPRALHDWLTGAGPRPDFAVR